MRTGVMCPQDILPVTYTDRDTRPGTLLILNSYITMVGDNISVPRTAAAAYTVLIMATNRAPKQWLLTKNETVTSFQSWKENIVYVLSPDANFAPFLNADITWLRKSTNDTSDVPTQSQGVLPCKNACSWNECCCGKLQICTQQRLLVFGRNDVSTLSI